MLLREENSLQSQQSALPLKNLQKKVAQILFEISCIQDFQISFSKRLNSIKGA